MAIEVLVVDDSRTTRQQLVQLLREEQYAVLEAQNGLEALQQISKHPELAVVICDLHMPSMDGLSLLRLVRSKRTNGRLPFVMLTTDTSPRTLEEAKSRGAQAFIKKPFERDGVLEAVRELTEQTGVSQVT